MYVDDIIAVSNELNFHSYCSFYDITMGKVIVTPYINHLYPKIVVNKNPNLPNPKYSIISFKVYIFFNTTFQYFHLLCIT